MKYSKELHDWMKGNNALCEHSGSVTVTYSTETITAMLDEIERLQAERRWIPVSERLPQIYDDCEGEKSDCCYVRDIHKCVWIAYYRPDEKDWYVLPTGIILTAVTHWMPLPEPPEELK